MVVYDVYRLPCRILQLCFSGMVIRQSNKMCSLDNLSTTTRIAVSLSFVFRKLNIKSIDISSHSLLGGAKGLKVPNCFWLLALDD